MNRRAFIGAAFAAPASVRMWTAGDQRVRHKYGHLTVEGHLAHKNLTGEDLRIFFNGTDVTHSSYEADDVEGYVLVYCRDEKDHTDWSKQGHLHVRGPADGICSMRLTGDVVIAAG